MKPLLLFVGLRLCGAALLLFMEPTAPGLAAADWPQFRGPGHDGVSVERIRTNWLAQPPEELWKVPLDPGLSSVAVAGGRVFTLVRRPAGTEHREHCVALDAATGAELWSSIPLGLAFYPDGGVGLDDGPRSTPAVDDGRVYVLTSYLGLHCLDSMTGAVIWSKDLVAEYGGTVIAWQNSASPLLVGDLVVLNANGRAGERLIAFRTHDGTEAWKGQDDGLTHTSPTRATIGGIEQVIFYTGSGLVGLSPADGSVLWRQAILYNGVSAACSPVVAGDAIYWSAAYGTGAGVTRITGTVPALSATELWRKPAALQNHWSTPVHIDGFLYGIYGQSLTTLKCVELATGLEKWSRGGFGYGSVVVVGGDILVLSDSGELVLVAPDTSDYREIARYRALTGKCWNMPAVSEGRIFLRSTTEAVCLDVALPVPPPLTLRPELADDGALFRLVIANQDGSAIDPDRVARIGVLATDVSPGATGWTRQPGTAVLVDGRLHFDDPVGEAHAQRFYRVEEQP